jgi:hypothetical protein
MAIVQNENELITKCLFNFVCMLIFASIFIFVNDVVLYSFRIIFVNENYSDFDVSYTPCHSEGHKVK